MSKERLGFDVEREMKHLKKIVDKDDSLTLSSRFVKYFIEQAERVQELEGELTYYKMVTESYLDMEQQNKRYHKALEFVDDELQQVLHANKSLDVKMFYIENAKRKLTEALEGEE